MVLRIVLIGLLLFGAVEQASAQPYRVFLVMSYHPEFTWTQQCYAGIRQALDERYEIETHYMDTKRIAAAEFEAQAKQAWQAVSAYNPDLLMVGDDNALRLLGPRIEQSDFPVVFFGVNSNPRQYFKDLPKNMTGVLERTPVLGWLRHLQRILPQAQRGLILLDDSPTSEGIMEVSYNDRVRVKSGQMVVDYRTLTRWDEWQQAINGAPEQYDFVVMAGYFTLRGPEEEVVSTRDVIQWTSANSRIPVFANQDYAVDDKGVIGALVVSGERHGALAATLVQDILENGREPRKIFPVSDRDGDFYFNRKQLQRFGLTLPEDLARQARYR